MGHLFPRAIIHSVKRSIGVSKTHVRTDRFLKTSHRVLKLTRRVSKLTRRVLKLATRCRLPVLKFKSHTQVWPGLCAYTTEAERGRSRKTVSSKWMNVWWILVITSTCVCWADTEVISTSAADNVKIFVYGAEDEYRLVSTKTCGNKKGRPTPPCRPKRIHSSMWWYIPHYTTLYHTIPHYTTL